MTYRLEPIVEKIKSTVILVFPDESFQQYSSGIETAATVFDKRYVIDEIRAVDNKIQIELIEIKMADSTTWVGEERTFF